MFYVDLFSALTHRKVDYLLIGLSEIVRAFKTFSARRINESCETSGASVWQRNYYEHVIRNDADYNRIAEYIANNPQRWTEDLLHPYAIEFSSHKTQR